MASACNRMRASNWPSAISTIGPAQGTRISSSHPRPSNALTLEQLLNVWMTNAKNGIAQLKPHDAASLDKARAAFRERLTFALLASTPAAAAVLSEKRESLPSGETLVLGRSGKSDRVPAVWLAPAKPNPEMEPTLIVHPDGAATVTNSSIAKALLNRGGAVLTVVLPATAAVTHR